MSIHSDDFEVADQDETRRREPQTFGQRHGLKIFGAVLATMFAVVIAMQVAC